MNLLSEEADLSFLSSQYENLRFHMFRSDDVYAFISCITCICDTSADIIDNWRAIQNLVSVHHQPSGSLASWNVYLVFVTIETVPVWEKYEIENNKYAARKIILDRLSEIISPEQLAVELQKHLLGSDLTLDSRINEPRVALLSLEEYVRGAPLDSKTESREKRASMINNIIELLNQNENKKS
ncbi:Uncharacterised protein [Serratia proteamaculans]|uniref:ABC-three component system middle component 1 n=1 Tax=Serratia proteamaculans TaxID=28151 RepID=UPI00217715B3|nr:Uncharacterised protein [Serratia proteamaculans]